MNLGIKLTFAAVLLALIGLLWWPGNQLVALRKANVQRASELARLQGQIDQQTRRAARARATSAFLSKAIEAEQAGTSAELALKTASSKPVATSSSAVSTASTSSSASANLAIVYAKWGRLLKQLHLPREQEAQFVNLESSLEDRKSEIEMEAASVGKRSSQPPYHNEMNQAYAQTDRAVQALLTPTDKATYKTYSQDGSAFDFVLSFVNGAILSQPLADSQIEQLTQIVADTSERNRYGWVVWGTMNWDQALPRAQPILTPEQFDALRAQAAMKSANQKVGQMISGKQ